MALPQTTVLGLETRGRAIIATINDPPTRNAMTDRLVGDLLTVLSAAEEDRAWRTLVIRGADGLFCAGADLKDAAASDGSTSSEDPMIAVSRKGAMVYHRLNACPLTVIAAVDGPAFGGGFGLACCADILLCGPRARFALSETRLGLVAAQIAPFVVSRLGLPAARRLALTGVRLGPADAVAVGLVDAAYDDPKALDEAVSSLIEEIKACAPEANAATKALLLSFGAFDADSYVDHAAHVFTRALRGPEGVEGIAAFTAKRRPMWVERD